MQFSEILGNYLWICVILCHSSSSHEAFIDRNPVVLFVPERQKAVGIRSRSDDAK
jgi:hypothetical protein